MKFGIDRANIRNKEQLMTKIHIKQVLLTLRHSITVPRGLITSPGVVLVVLVLVFVVPGVVLVMIDVVIRRLRVSLE